jgi:hypothetical protein
MMELTLALHAVSVDTGADDHDIVNDGEAALAANPVALAVLEATVRQNGCFVESHSTAVLRLGEGQLLGMEELPY